MLRLLLLLSSGRVYLLSEANATAVLRIAQKNVMVHLSHGVETACFSRGFKSFLVLFPILLFLYAIESGKSILFLPFILEARSV